MKAKRFKKEVEFDEGAYFWCIPFIAFGLGLIFNILPGDHSKDWIGGIAMVVVPFLVIYFSRKVTYVEVKE